MEYIQVHTTSYRVHTSTYVFIPSTYKYTLFSYLYIHGTTMYILMPNISAAIFVCTRYIHVKTTYNLGFYHDIPGTYYTIIWYCYISPYLSIYMYM